MKGHHHTVGRRSPTAGHSWRSLIKWSFAAHAVIQVMVIRQHSNADHSHGHSVMMSQYHVSLVADESSASFSTMKVIHHGSFKIPAIMSHTHHKYLQ
ncbi:hypothetical protein CEXT_142481 [Caerostris extrusa]|uniref:Uncharacterized protein n=1 Tax=Caerostris extrusa TaxID=172846 RepID=A0AAV4UL78_CAEEX|nr:hypothetical protein CEXT_142481 [Caerostris extrusa]